jgi:hypothetical protein
VDTITIFEKAIENALKEYAEIPYAHGAIACEVVADKQRRRYLLMSMGWDGGQRIHSCLAHIEIIDGKIWIQSDNTEEGIATDLERAGISKDEIVLGFRQPEDRPFTGYAVA